MSALITAKTLSRLCRRELSTTGLLSKTRFKCSSGNTQHGLLWKLKQSPSSSEIVRCPLRFSSTKTVPKAIKTQREQRTAEILLQDIQQEFDETVTSKKKRSEQKIPSIETIIAADPTLQSPDYFQVHNLFTVRDLFDARVHLGHKVGSLDERMKDFIFGSRFDSIIFDLDKTAFHLRQALNFTAHIAYRKGIILFVTRSPQTMQLVEKTAIECGEYAHCREWNTHVMTNSESKFGGITRLPDLMILFNTLDTVMAPHGAVFDANKMLIPTVGIVDSNCNPNLITYPVPGNDDTISAVEFYCKVFKEAIMRGKEKRKNVDKQQFDVVKTSNTTEADVASASM